MRLIRLAVKKTVRFIEVIQKRPCSSASKDYSERSLLRQFLTNEVNEPTETNSSQQTNRRRRATLTQGGAKTNSDFESIQNSR